MFKTMCLTTGLLLFSYTTTSQLPEIPIKPTYRSGSDRDSVYWTQIAKYKVEFLEFCKQLRDFVDELPPDERINYPNLPLQLGSSSAIPFDGIMYEKLIFACFKRLQSNNIDC